MTPSRKKGKHGRKHYSTKDFSLKIPNFLLARYFQERELSPDFDFSAMPEIKPDELFSAWMELPEEQRNKMDAEFQEIFEMGCDKGFKAIINEAE